MKSKLQRVQSKLNKDLGLTLQEPLAVAALEANWRRYEAAKFTVGVQRGLLANLRGKVSEAEKALAEAEAQATECEQQRPALRTALERAKTGDAQALLERLTIVTAELKQLGE